MDCGDAGSECMAQQDIGDRGIDMGYVVQRYRLVALPGSLLVGELTIRTMPHLVMVTQPCGRRPLPENAGSELCLLAAHATPLSFFPSPAATSRSVCACSASRVSDAHRGFPRDLCVLVCVHACPLSPSGTCHSVPVSCRREMCAGRARGYPECTRHR